MVKLRELDWIPAETSDDDSLVTDGGLELLKHGEVMQWLGEQRLYAKMMETPSLYTGNTLFQGFKTARANTDIGQLYAIESGIKAAWEYSSTLGATMDSHYQTINNLMAQLDGLNTQMISATPQDSLQILNQKTALLANLNNTTNAYQQAENSFEQGAKSQLQSLKLSNEGLSVEFHPAVNKKAFNNYLMAYWLSGNTLPQASLTELYKIGQECPLIGGNAVFEARDLYELAANTEVYWEKLEDCELPPTTGREKPGESIQPTSVGNGSQAKVFPNPTAGELTVDVIALGEFTGTATIHDLSGRVVLTTQITTGVNKLRLNLKDGIYIVSIAGKEGIISRSKVVIMR
ncbi:MAG: T9SS type A sorting domain-containing protein [Saprospiraceae bacterium]|nr:T9SS type A sorting domain-containing protein [Saprospiraceae bacterium]